MKIVALAGGGAGIPILIRDIGRDTACLNSPSDFMVTAECRREMAAVFVRRAFSRL